MIKLNKGQETMSNLQQAAVKSILDALHFQVNNLTKESFVMLK